MYGLFIQSHYRILSGHPTIHSLFYHLQNARGGVSGVAPFLLCLDSTLDDSHLSRAPVRLRLDVPDREGHCRLFLLPPSHHLEVLLLPPSWISLISPIYVALQI